MKTPARREPGLFLRKIGARTAITGTVLTPPELQEEDILYRDDDLLVVNKPAGVPVHGSRILEGQPHTLYAMARSRCGHMVHAVHRLDRPVSGAIVLAINKQTLSALSQSFEARRVTKRYLAVVRGWVLPADTIDYPLLPPRDERSASSEPRSAITRYERLATVETPWPVKPYASSRYSLLALYPETGRRHQLRRHLKHISHHLVGDTTYGRGEHNRMFRENLGCKRLLLHSASIEFEHPRTGETLLISAPLDAAFARVLRMPGWSSHPEMISWQPGLSKERPF